MGRDRGALPTGGPSAKFFLTISVFDRFAVKFMLQSSQAKLVKRGVHRHSKRRLAIMIYVDQVSGYYNG